VKVSVVRPHELGAGALASWRAMQAANSAFANPFLSPGFALAAGRVRASARVAVLEDEQQISGFFAFDAGRFGVGGPVAPGVSDCQAVVHVPGFSWDPRELLQACDLDVWEFDNLLQEQAASANGKVALHSSPIIDVSQGYEAYLGERQASSRKVLKSTLYKLRKLERNVGGTTFDFDAGDRQALELLMRWKSDQYRRTGHRDQFAVDWVVRLVWELFETRTDGCTGTLSVLRAGERIVAAHFGLRSESSLSCWFPAYDLALAKYSPGLSLHLKMAEAAAATGIRHLDLGKGDEEYKQSLKNAESTVAEGWLDRPSAVTFLRRVQRAPRRMIVDFILSHPSLRLTARRALRQFGSIRSRA
jgi:CelD/BcsL family acetyltransferase involved in cellulose biosynthesis